MVETLSIQLVFILNFLCLWCGIFGFIVICLAFPDQTGLSLTTKYFYWPVSRRYIFCGSFIIFLSCVCYAFVRIDALWSPAGRGMASWLSFVMSDFEIVTFTLVSWVRCGTWLYKFLIFALFLTFIITFKCIATCLIRQVCYLERNSRVIVGQSYHVYSMTHWLILLFPYLPVKL